MLENEDLLYLLRLQALFHDIGKLNPEHHYDHEKRGNDLIRDTFGEIRTESGKNAKDKLVWGGLNHHKPKKNNRYERLLCIADSTASVLDKASKYLLVDREDFISKSNPLSGARIPIGLAFLNEAQTTTKSLLQLLCRKSRELNPRSVHDEFINLLIACSTHAVNNEVRDYIEKSMEIPSETRYPLNATSLWAHHKATSTCLDIMFPLLTRKKIFVSVIGIDFHLSEFKRRAPTIKEFEAREDICRDVIIKAIKAINHMTVGPANFPLSSVTNVIYPDIGYLALHPEILSYIDKLLLSFPVSSEIELEHAYDDLLSSILEALSQEDLSDVVDIEAAHGLFREEVEFPDRAIPMRNVVAGLREKLKELIANLDESRVQSFSTSKINPMNYVPRENFLCSLCEKRTSETSRYGRHLCSRCSSYMRIARGVYLDDIADETEKIAYIGLRIPAEKLLFDERSLYYGQLLPWCPSRMHETLVCIYEAYRDVLETVESIVGESKHYVFDIELVNPPQAFVEQFDNGVALGDTEINKERFAILLKKNDTGFSMDLFGVNSAKRADVIKDLLSEVNVDSHKAVEVEFEPRPSFIFQIDIIRRLKEYSMSKARLISHSYSDLLFVVPADKCLKLISHILSRLSERIGLEKSSIEVNFAVADKKEPISNYLEKLLR